MFQLLGGGNLKCIFGPFSNKNCLIIYLERFLIFFTFGDFRHPFSLTFSFITGVVLDGQNFEKCLRDSFFVISLKVSIFYRHNFNHEK